MQKDLYFCPVADSDSRTVDEETSDQRLYWNLLSLLKKSLAESQDQKPLARANKNPHNGAHRLFVKNSGPFNASRARPILNPLRFKPLGK